MEIPNDVLRLFKNNQRKNEAQPAMRGSAKCRCEKCGHATEYVISVWDKPTKTGNTYLSGNIKPMVEDEYAMKRRQEEKAAEASTPTLPDSKDEKDELPF